MFIAAEMSTTQPEIRAQDNSLQNIQDLMLQFNLAKECPMSFKLYFRRIATSLLEEVATVVKKGTNLLVLSLEPSLLTMVIHFDHISHIRRWGPARSEGRSTDSANASCGGRHDQRYVGHRRARRHNLTPPNIRSCNGNPP